MQALNAPQPQYHAIDTQMVEALRNLITSGTYHSYTWQQVAHIVVALDSLPLLQINSEEKEVEPDDDTEKFGR